jgi:hypothetical protein
MNDFDDIEAGELLKLPVEERKKLIGFGVDMLFQQVIITSQITDRPVPKILNETLFNIEEQIKEHTEKENFELCYYFTEIFWEANKRLEDLRKDKGNVFV